MAHDGRYDLLPSIRLGLALVCFLGCVIIYSSRSSLSFAIVCMVNSTAIEESQHENLSVHKQSSCNTANSSHFDEDKIIGSFLWSKQTQGGVLSAFFWGYISSQIAAGYLASRYGGRLVIGSSVFMGSLVTLISPLIANLDVNAFIGLRGLLGVFQASTFPAMHQLWSVWAPPLERSLLTGVSYAGVQIGNMLVMPISGLLCKHGPLGGWPSIFYLLGFLGLLWCILWFTYVADSPQKHRRITEKERNYIVFSLRENIGKDADHEKHKNVPWILILKARPVWACYVGQFAADWGGYMMQLSLPSYMNDVFGFDLASVGILIAMPFLANFTVVNIGGYFADKFQQAGILSGLGRFNNGRFNNGRFNNGRFNNRQFNNRQFNNGRFNNGQFTVDDSQGRILRISCKTQTRDWP